MQAYATDGDERGHLGTRAVTSAGAITVTAFADDSLGTRSAPVSAAIAQQSQTRLLLPAVIRAAPPQSAATDLPAPPRSAAPPPASHATPIPIAPAAVPTFTATTGTDGRYTLTDLPATTYVVTRARDHHGQNTRSPWARISDRFHRNMHLLAAHSPVSERVSWPTAPIAPA